MLFGHTALTQQSAESRYSARGEIIDRIVATVAVPESLVGTHNFLHDSCAVPAGLMILESVPLERCTKCSQEPRAGTGSWEIGMLAREAMDERMERGMTRWQSDGEMESSLRDGVRDEC
jgi:hypothetical protein